MKKTAPNVLPDTFQSKVYEEWGRIVEHVDAVITFDWNVISDQLSFNPAGQSLLGLTGGTGTMAGFLDSLDRENAGRLENNLNRILAGETSEIDEFRVLTSADAIVHIAGRAAVIVDADGHRHVVGVQFDQTRQVESSRKRKETALAKSHQIKNVLGIVSGVASMTQRTGQSPEDFVRSLNSRIQALAKSADLVAESTNGYFPLTVFVATVAAAFSQGQKIEVKSCSRGIDTDACQMLALAVHELTVNALRFGALSMGGDVSVRFNAQDDGSLELVWQEDAAGFVEPDEARKGFGWQILSRAVAREFGTRPTIEWAHRGIVYTVSIPADRLIRIGDPVAGER